MTNSRQDRTRNRSVLKGWGQVPLRKAIAYSLQTARETPGTLERCLLWGLVIPSFDHLVDPDPFSGAMFIICLLISLGIGFTSSIPWRWKIAPRNSGKIRRLIFNGSVSFLYGAFIFLFSALLGVIIVIGFEPFWEEGFLETLPVLGSMGFIPSIIGYQIAENQQRQREARRVSWWAAKLDEQMIQARLAALRAQINPHFFFNTLNTIAALIPTRPNDAERAVELLATSLRPVLMRTPAMITTLAEEWKVAEAYTEIELLRFGSKVQLDFHLAPETLPRTLPSLCIQPLLENAFRHGAAHSEDQFRIACQTAIQEGALQIRIASAPQSEWEQLSTLAQHSVPLQNDHALGNVRARLRMLFQSGSDLAINITPSGLGAVVLLTIHLPREGFSTEIAK